MTKWKKKMDKHGYAIYTGDFIEDMKTYFEEHRLACEELGHLCQERTVIEIREAIEFMRKQHD